MALKPMLDETPKGPSPEDVLAKEREERARLEQEIRERQASYEARLDEMSRGMQRPQVQYAPPSTPTPENTGLTAEEIQKNPDKALEMLQRQIQDKAVKEVEQRYGHVVAGMANQAVNMELEGLKNKKYWAEAQKDLQDYFASNPQELQPGRASEVYNYLVGANIDKYEEVASARRATDQATTEMRREANQPVAVDSPMRRATPRPDEDDDKGKEPTLTEEEELVREAYNAYGANISRKEWVEISRGKIFPKKRATDWDAGYYKEERHVSRYEG